MGRRTLFVELTSWAVFDEALVLRVSFDMVVDRSNSPTVAAPAVGRQPRPLHTRVQKYRSPSCQLDVSCNSHPGREGRGLTVRVLLKLGKLVAAQLRLGFAHGWLESGLAARMSRAEVGTRERK